MHGAQAPRTWIRRRGSQRKDVSCSVLETDKILADSSRPLRLAGDGSVERSMGRGPTF